MPSESFTCARCGLYNDRQGPLRWQYMTTRDACDTCFLDRKTGKTSWYNKGGFMAVYTMGGLFIWILPGGMLKLWLDSKFGTMSQPAAAALLTLPGLGITALLWRDKGRKK